MTQSLNILPSPTWNHLGVNCAPKEAALPAVPPEGFGLSDTDYGPLPAGVAVVPGLPEVFQDFRTGSGPALEDFVDRHSNTGCTLRVTGRAQEPLVITHTLTEKCPASVAEIAIYAQAGSDLTLVEVFRSQDQTPGFSACRTRIYAEPQAHVKVVEVQMLGQNSRRFSTMGVKVLDGAKVELYRAELGGCGAVCGSLAELTGKGGEYHTGTIYFGDGDALLDFNDVSEHTGHDTLSEIHAAGVLAGSCRKTLRGTIDFRRGAVHAVGHESEDVLLLSPHVKNLTAPLILCGEELVEGQHAATAGRIDEGILYYMAARGMDESTARRLMVQARYAPVVDQVPLPNLKCEISDFIERRLGRCAGV